MKRGAKLGVLVAALAVLVGAWGLINYLTTQKEAADAALEITDDDIDLAVGEHDDVTALSWTYSESTVNLTYDADSETWVNADDETCPIDQEAVDALVTAVSSTCASQEVTDVEDFEQYGLDEPTLTVTASTADATVTYAVGSTSLTGEYYVRVDGGTSVYTETGLLAGAFQVQIDDLLQLESAPEDIASVVSLSVETDVTSYTVEAVEDAAAFYCTDAYTWFLTELDGVDYTAAVVTTAEAETEVSEESEASEEAAATALITTQAAALDEDSAAALYELVSGISFLSCETWNADDLSAYGLDAPPGGRHPDLPGFGGGDPDLHPGVWGLHQRLCVCPAGRFQYGLSGRRVDSGRADVPGLGQHDPPDPDAPGLGHRHHHRCHPGRSRYL